MSKKRRRSRWPLLLVLLVGLGAVGYLARDSFLPTAEEATLGQEVQRGPLNITVVERGNLKAANSVDLLSEVEGRTTILSLVEEGVMVEPGDLLCELDASDLIERRVSQEISLQNARATFVKAEQNYEIQRSQNESDVARAERELEFARIDLEKYIEGDAPQDQQKAEESVLLADEELTRATQDLLWSEALAEKGFLEKTQLDADRLSQKRAEIQVNQAQRALELLKQYEFPRRKAELEANVDEKGRELERVRLQAHARIADFEANLQTSKAKLDLEEEKLSKLDVQIERSRIVAPVSGMVVYAQQEGSRWGSNEPIQEGVEVRERQAIITIPSSEGMITEASLHESVLDKVEVGMPVIVAVDALPEVSFPGRVKFKAVLPDQNSWWANPDLRVYRTEIEILESDPRMRPGMSCSIEILVEEIADTLFVPVQSVFLDGGETVCFVAEQGRFEICEVDVGQNNGEWVQVYSGVEQGEVVSLSVPAGMTLRPSEVRENGLGGDSDEGTSDEKTRAQASGGGSEPRRGSESSGRGEARGKGARGDGKSSAAKEDRSKETAADPANGY